MKPALAPFVRSLATLAECHCQGIQEAFLKGATGCLQPVLVGGFRVPEKANVAVDLRGCRADNRDHGGASVLRPRAGVDAGRRATTRRPTRVARRSVAYRRIADRLRPAHNRLQLPRLELPHRLRRHRRMVLRGLGPQRYV